MARNRARLCLVGLLLCALLGLACAGCAPALPERTGSGQAPVASDTGAAQALEETAAASVLPEGPDFTGWRDGAPFICYGERDALGRATAACALLGRELLTDRDGEPFYMLMNGRCPWRRKGNGLPQGAGNISGILVHTVLERYGDCLGPYQIRPVAAGKPSWYTRTFQLSASRESRPRPKTSMRMLSTACGKSSDGANHLP